MPFKLEIYIFSMKLALQICGRHNFHGYMTLTILPFLFSLLQTYNFCEFALCKLISFVNLQIDDVFFQKLFKRYHVRLSSHQLMLPQRYQRNFFLFFISDKFLDIVDFEIPNKEMWDHFSWFTGSSNSMAGPLTAQTLYVCEMLARAPATRFSDLSRRSLSAYGPWDSRKCLFTGPKESFH